MLRLPGVLLLSCIACLAQAPDAFVPGNDLPALREGVRRDPENLGLRLRTVQALARPDPETTHPDVAAQRIKEIQEHLVYVRERSERHPIPLRYLALEGFRAGEFEKSLDLGVKLLEVDPTDTEVARNILKARMRLKQEGEAAAFFANWLAAGTVPSIGALEGLLGSLMVSSAFRDAFGEEWKKILEAHPQDPFVHLYNGMYLAELGRLESAWKSLHEAERLGLIDMRTGGRHPFIGSLAARSREVDATPASTDGLDVAEIAAACTAAPDHIGLKERHARLLDLAGRKAEAAAIYAEARSANPAYWPISYRLGEIAFQDERYDAAVDALKEAHTRFPHLIGLNLLLVEALARKGDPVAAATVLLRVAERYDAGLATRQALLRLKDIAGGATLEALLAAMGKPGTSAGIESHRAMTLWLLGRKEEAKAAALLAERVGAAGRDGYPTPILLETHGLPDPHEPKPEKGKDGQ